MPKKFDRAFDHLLEIEKGFQKDKNDPGNYTPSGELKGTKYGISARAYPDLDIESLTRAQAKEIYRRDFWDKIGGDRLPPGVDFFTFSAAVHSGPEAAGKWLQDTLGGLKVDGVVGSQTLGAADQIEDGLVFLDAMAQRRNSVIQRLPAASEYAKGWQNRVQHDLAAAHKMFGLP